MKLAASLAKTIEENGGLEVYQAASKQGQSNERGGDSSRVLLEWLQETKMIKDVWNNDDHKDLKTQPMLRCLEVGALSNKNYISRFPDQIEMTRIDLNSQGVGIEKQDFMERPLPSLSTDRFDIISLSLVLNYVPDPVGRGEMLKRISQFLRHDNATWAPLETVLPTLFLVLPLPCVENSRYLDEKLLLQIMANFGFTLTKEKKTQKLCYYLFSLTGEARVAKISKRKVRDGPAMNNFCIVVD